MPRGDGTGPLGTGPMTGRGMGYCALASNAARPGLLEGFAGVTGAPVTLSAATKKEVSQMPAGNGTGPWGMGPMTGRAAGFCAGYGVPGYLNPLPGRGFRLGQGFGGQFGMGFGRGRGGGRGWRNMFYATGSPGWARFGGAAYPAAYPKPDPEWEKQALKSQAEALQAEMEEIKKRLSELEVAPEAK